MAHEIHQEGMTARHALLVVFLTAFSAATAMLIYQESRCRRLLSHLRSVLAGASPSSRVPDVVRPHADGLEGLEEEIRSLATKWSEFCVHCQHQHDSEMTRAEHLATIGELAAGLAHEIRNPLAGIVGAIEIITQDFPREHPDRVILVDLNKEVRRIERTLNELLAYARPKPPQFGLTDIQETIARTVHFARQQIGERKIEIVFSVGPDVPGFLADPEQLHQVLLNLVLNSIQSIEGEGRVAIEVDAKRMDELSTRDQVEIAVSDTGRGIQPEHLHRIFRPFYTTKQGGTGLGLSLCSRIIDAHGGTLRAESEPQKGSRFTIRLPLRTVAEELVSIHAQ